MSPIRIVLMAALALVALAIVALPRFLVSEPAVAPGVATAADPSRAGVEQIVHDYLLANPAILRDMMAKLQQQDRAESSAQQSSVITSERDAIYNSPRQVVLGNPQGDVTLVEFFDYNCGYCRKALPDTEALLKSDPKLRLVLKEFPVLGEGSRDAARVAVAVHRQAPDKYLDFHRALLSSDAAADGDSAIAAARAVGVDIDKLSAGITAPDIDDPLRESHQIAGKLGIDGTPTYIIADTVVPGAVGLSTLQGIISSVRQCGKPECS